MCGEENDDCAEGFAALFSTDSDASDDDFGSLEE